MPDYFISLNTSCSIAASDINDVRNHRKGQSRSSTAPNTSYCESITWYRNNAAARCFRTGSQLSVTEFRGAQVLTGCITTVSETYKYYYANNNNGSITVNICSNTVNTPVVGAKSYAYSDNAGDTFTISSSNSKTYTNVDAGGGNDNPAVRPPYRYCDMVIKDNTTGAVATQEVLINYNGANTSYTCVQSRDDLSL